MNISTRTFRLKSIFPIFGISGAILVSVFVLITALTYTGKGGEPFSLLNHFISELGEVGISENAWLFNLGLMIAGLAFAVFCLGLGLTLKSVWGILGMIAGLIASISVGMVGVFPMNNLTPHILAAMTYFRSGLFTVLLFGIAIFGQPKGQVKVARWANMFSLVAIASYAAFLIHIQTQDSLDGASLDPSHISNRPDVWPIALLEWSIFFSTILWFFAIALAARQKTSEGAQTA